MRADWKPEKEPNMDEEIELIKKWVKEREDFINEQDKTEADSYKSVRGRTCTDKRKSRAVWKEPTAISRKMKSLGIFSNEFIAELVELDIKTIERIKANDEQSETRTS